MGQLPSETTIFRHYRPPGSDWSDIKNGTVPFDSSLTTKIFPLLKLSRTGGGGREVRAEHTERIF